MSAQPSHGPGDVDVVGARIVAQLIDYVVMFVLLVLAVFGVAAVVGSGGGGEGILVLALLAIGLGYGTVLEGRYGKTIGKMVTDVRVVGDRGREIGYGQAFIRNIPALFGGWLTWLVGIAAIAIDEQNQRLFDMAADTYVVRDGSSPKLTTDRREEFTR
ncbi:MAG: RDD family protein [Halolamina sp.]